MSVVNILSIYNFVGIQLRQVFLLDFLFKLRYRNNIYPGTRYNCTEMKGCNVFTSILCHISLLFKVFLETKDQYGHYHCNVVYSKTFMHTSGLSDCQYQHLVSVAELDKEFHHV